MARTNKTRSFSQYNKNFQQKILQFFRKQQEILSILTKTESPQKMFFCVNGGDLSTTAMFVIAKLPKASPWAYKNTKCMGI